MAGVGQCALPRGRMYALGFVWRPWVSVSFAWQAWDNVHCQGVGCMPWGSSGVPGSPPLLRGRRGAMYTAKGSDVRPGIRLASLGLRLFCVAGVGQCALPRGRMYALGFLWRRWVIASFAWQVWDNVHCQGVGCTPWGSSGVPGSPPLFHDRRGTMCTAKGSDVRPGVPLASLGLRLFCVTRVGQCALPRGRMYALGFVWRPWVSASFAWQAWDNVHCQGVGCTPWGSSGVLRLFCVAGVGQCALPRGRMYALGFLWRFWVSVSFAWQAWDNVHCQGVGCTPWGSAGVAGSPPLLRGRRGTLSRGRMYTLGFRWRPWVSASFAPQAWDNVRCRGVGCTPWRPSGVRGSLLLLRGRRGTMCTAKGSDVRPGSFGVPGSPPLLRGRRGTMCIAGGFCVAGVGHCAHAHSHTHSLTHSLDITLLRDTHTDIHIACVQLHLDRSPFHFMV